MPLQATSGAASYDGFGGGVPFVPIYIEQIFATHLYTGNGSTQTITNGIDLSGKGGLVWTKCRGATARSHILIDTVRGASSYLSSNLTDAAATTSVYITGFNANGYGIDYGNAVNASPNTFASWTFRKQPKFFDVVTYTGNGTTQTISHSLGSVPGFIIVKRTNSAEDWWCFHRYDFTYRFKLNATNAAVNTTSVKYLGNNVIDVAPTSTTFTVGDTGGLNGSGDSFVAYLFAHNAGGFGLTGTDNVISCGSFTTSAGGVANVTLNYEPQWVLVKRTDSTGDWFLMDNIRGFTADPNNPVAMLRPNLSNAENAASFVGWSINATGFGWSAGAASATYIYIAIRRGPMKTPTSGTSVFSPNAVADDSSAITTNFPVDGYWEAVRTGNANNFVQQSRLTGGGQFLKTSSTAAEDSTGFTTVFENNTGYTPGTFGSSSIISYAYRRAPGFFDVVCYTGTGANRTVSHNLGVAPELMLIKRRSAAVNWAVYNQTIGNTKFLVLNANDFETTDTTFWNSTSPTASVFSLGSSATPNQNTQTYVAYLFASCPGVSKVGSYTGTGTTKQIDCGFTGGARFVMIKRTDSTGDWYVWDTARGIVAGNDPYLLLNSTAAEVTNTDYIDTYSAGFEISSTAPAAINANGGTFIFLAIA